jgi:flagellar hook-associated protein 3 FlgL
MSITGVGNTSSILLAAITDMRDKLTDLQRQLGTGKKADTYAGLGLDRGLTVSLRAQLSAVGGYDNTITNVGLRLDIAQTTLGRMTTISHTMKQAMQTATFDIGAGNRTSAQNMAVTELGELAGLLNTQAGDRYLFSGRSGDQPAVDSVDHILDGNGAQAGLRQIIAERNQADLGNGLGRLIIPAAAGNTVSLSEDVAGSPFGFKLASVSSTLNGATVSGPSGSPPAASIALGATNAGDKVTFNFNLPDGTTSALTLTATANNPPGAGEFTIGANATATAANLRAALASGVGTLARTDLAAASAAAAANDFFNTDAAHPPQRVGGPPFASATSLVAGTSANTLTWYTGEAGSDPARSTAIARVDSTIAVSYGMRANEQGIRTMMASVATLAAMSFSPSDADASARYTALTQRLGGALAGAPGDQQVDDIASDLASTQAALGAAKNRHQQTTATLGSLLDDIEGAPQEEVATQILSLQTRMQASMQVTAMLHQLTLMNYLPVG